MTNPVSRHPGAETMAAFLEGKLDPDEVADVAAHLSECRDCRTVTGEAARFEEEEARAAAAATARPRPFSPWQAWAAAAALIAASTPLLFRAQAPIATLVEASPREYRRVQGRLSGFPWARLQGGQRSAVTPPAELELNSAAYDVLRRTADDEAVKARHAAGVAHLLIHQNADSLEKLESAAGDSKNARIWNDLAAARYTVAVREGENRQKLLPAALDAVNRAIQIDPKLPDAHFNRALILERMNQREAARKQWQDYLALDPSSAWSNEARQHLRNLGEPAAAIDFGKELARAAGDRNAVASLARRFPQESRRWGEGPLLGEWAEAILRGDAARAREKLDQVRAIGEAVAALRGEHLLMDAVLAIDRSREPHALAEAHRIHWNARLAYRDRRVSEAYDGFREAEVRFRRAHSPMADAAAAWSAQCTFDRAGEATELLASLRARIDPGRYPALAAQLDDALALQAVSSADWGTAIVSAASAAKIYTSLGEPVNAAWADLKGAIALERIGAGDAAWRKRIPAMAFYAAPSQHRPLAVILHGAAQSLAADDEVPLAAAIMDLAIATGGHAEQQAAALSDRARLAARMGDVAAAHRWLSEARAAAPGIADDAIREARLAQIGVVQAVLECVSDPSRAVATLDRSIEYFESHRQGMLLPDALLERARARRAAGRLGDAIDDYQAALRAIDRQRANAKVSVEFLDVAAQVIDESIDAHLQRGDAAAAFAVADRAHAMAGEDYRPARVPEDVAVLEYAVLPHAIAIFCVTSDGIVAKKVGIERPVLGARVLSFVRRMRDRRDVRAEAKALHALLIAPVAPHIAGVRELVIVPDRQLSLVPFAALFDGSRHLIETHTVRVALSAAAVPPAANPPLDAKAVVISDPATDRATPLPWSRDEAGSIAALYGAEVIEGREATRARVTEAISRSSLVHYAGHADSNVADSYGALLLARDGPDSGLLTAREIARLQLRGNPLVVLSACGTLRGKATHVAGMPSLARAFLGAGAHAVTGTLWEVDDDVTGPLFLRFHQELRRDAPPAEALRAAQREMLHSSDERLRHPASWSAVQVLSNL